MIHLLKSKNYGLYQKFIELPYILTDENAENICNVECDIVQWYKRFLRRQQSRPKRESRARFNAGSQIIKNIQKSPENWNSPHLTMTGFDYRIIYFICTFSENLECLTIKSCSDITEENKRFLENTFGERISFIYIKIFFEKYIY
jgi:hypothetical protein